MTDLIERLNAFVEHLVPVPEYAEEAATVAEAASELSRLQSALQVAEERIGVLTKERDEAKIQASNYAYRADKAKEERDAAGRRSEAFWKPQHDAAAARAEKAEKERDEAKRIIAECAAALGNGAFISPSATIGFIASLPEEIRLHLSHLREETK